jgi:hypothetical protein
VIWLLSVPFRLVFGAAGFGLRAGYGAGRLLGYRRMAVFGAGVAVGLLAAPRPGRELRDRLRRLLEERMGVDALTEPELLERVRSELMHHPRTWHLPQPAVEVAGQEVILRGQVPSDGARADLVRTVSALPGVTGVDDQLVVTGTPVGV